MLIESKHLLNNIEKIHTTELGELRIRKNLKLETRDIVNWCKNKVKESKNIFKRGKNWYITIENCIITINANSYTIITAHKNKKSERWVTAQFGQASLRG